MDLEQTLKELSELDAPTGAEDEVAEYMTKHFKGFGFEIKRDTLGNVIARKGSGKKVLVAAHMDEISMAVTEITEKGMLKFVKVGGIYDGTLGTARVKVHGRNGKISGVIGLKPPHLMKDEEMKKLQESSDMLIDVGAKDKKETQKMGIHPGSPITFEAKFTKLNGKLVGKAFDNRIGCAILLKIAEDYAKKKPSCDLYLVGTVREETGLFGAGTSAFAIEPDFAIALDTTTATDDKEPFLGKGPAISVIEGGGRGLIMPKHMIEWIEDTAKKAKIPLQFEVSERGATDASRMQYIRHGIHTASIGVPTKYIHSQSEMAEIKDLENTEKLVKELIKELPTIK